MSEYAVVKLIANNSMHFPTPHHIGPIEVRNKGYDLPGETDALERSIKLNKELVDLDLCMRLSILIEGENENDAIDEADKNFEEALDALSKEGFISIFELLESGFTKKLSTNEIRPIHRQHMNLGPHPMFAVEPELFPGIRPAEFIYLKRDTELGRRYLNALHWSRLSQWEKNLQLKILFNWFASEALVQIDNNDSIVPKIMLALGFPLKEKSREFSEKFIQELSSYKDYRTWRKKILSDYELIRDFRNKSVHAGFRRFDLSNALLKKYSFLANAAKISLFSLADTALNQRIETAESLWAKAAELLEKTQIINHCHKNFLFSYSREDLH